MSDTAPSMLTIPTAQSIPSIDTPSTGFCKLSGCHNPFPTFATAARTGDCDRLCHMPLRADHNIVQEGMPRYDGGQTEGKKMQRLWGVVRDVVGSQEGGGEEGRASNSGDQANSANWYMRIDV